MPESGEFRPPIDRRYRLDQIVEAYQYIVQHSHPRAGASK